jgi:hypothetical protein
MPSAHAATASFFPNRVISHSLQIVYLMQANSMLAGSFTVESASCRELFRSIPHACKVARRLQLETDQRAAISRLFNATAFMQ